MDEYVMCWEVKYSRTYVQKMLRIYNAAGAPGEFLLLTSIEKRQVIYLSKLIHPTCKTPGWSLLLSGELYGRLLQVFTFSVGAMMLTSLFRQKKNRL